VAKDEMYSFMDGCSGYNQGKMAEEDKENITFILEWGVYGYNIMSFALCNALPHFKNW
jgi:hypothetical protein